MWKRPPTVFNSLLLVMLVIAGPVASGATAPPDPADAFRPPASETSASPAGPAESAVAPLTLPAASNPQRLTLPAVTWPAAEARWQLAQTSGPAAPEGTPHAGGDPAAGASMTEVNKQLSNPVSSYWSLVMQFNNYSLANHRWNYNMQFQPVLPISLTKDWNLISRPVFQLYNSVPVPLATDTTKHYNQTTAFGDLIDLEMLSPAHSGPWLLGLGPTFIFPTATSQYTGQGRWQAGPAAVVGYLSEEAIVGVFPQWWWSIGSAARPNTSQMNLQPFAAWFFAPGWSLGYSGNILANFMAPAKEVWTVPLGLAIGKVVKLGPLPVKFSIAGQWMAVHPSNNGQEWNIQLQITPVIPKLIKETLF